MYFFIIISIILVNLVLWSLNTKTSFMYAQKPAAPKPAAPKPAAPKPAAKPAAPKPAAQKPSAQKPTAQLKNKSKPTNLSSNAVKSAFKKLASGGSGGGSGGRPDNSKFSSTSGGKAPTQSRLDNAAKFFAKNPDRVNNPPDAYKGLVEAGYIKKGSGSNTFTVNINPPGQPPARVPGAPGSGGAVTGGGGSVGAPPGGSGSGGSVGGKPPGKLSGGLANQAWDDYGNKYANKTAVGDAKVVMTDTRMDKFGSDPKKVAEYNKQLAAQGKIPMAYMNTGMVDTPGQVGNDKAFIKLYNDLNSAGVLAGKDGKWKENILDGKKLLNDPSAMAKVKAAYTDFAKTMKDLGYKAINVDNLDFYNKGANSQLSKPEQQRLGQMWQSTVADVIHGQGMYAVAKNAPELATMSGSTYVQKWDAIVTENAKTNGWNDTAAYKKFADAGKPVWNFQTQTSYASQSLPGWMDNYAVGQGKQGWWQTGV
jgi:hypothetical protein